ncbi:MAG: hypothetical protein PHI44_05505 [Candidatus Ratteibacteria bacterium]|nr:hypothetical protein [Candidatus Ratteibacteria bacterium]
MKAEMLSRAFCFYAFQRGKTKDSKIEKKIIKNRRRQWTTNLLRRKMY